MAPALVLNPTAEYSWKDDLKNKSTVITTETVLLKESKPPLTIDQLIRQRVGEDGDHIIFSYPSSGTEYVDYTYRQLDIYASRLAQKYKQFIPQRTSSSDPERVVGLLGPSNLEYFISILALTKLGHTVLFLSTRISAAAYTSLLQTTGAEHILIDTSFATILDEVRKDFPKIQVSAIANYSDFAYPLTDRDEQSRFDLHLDPATEAKKISWIIHSSGSTGLPKPIYQTHNAALRNYASNLNLKGFITLPLYHAHGISSVFRAIHSRKQIYLYNASLPLTQQHLLNVMNRYEFQVLYGVPYALKLLGETQEGISALTKLKVVMFGGSACPDALGDRLVQHGVNLISHYGTTETGQLMTSARPIGDKAWDYVRLPANFRPFVSFEERGPGIFELVALEGLPSKVASNRPDSSYATKDLFSPHPTIADAWKYIARLDDTIVLMNGEKVTPIAFEQSVRDSKYVTEAVMFGSGKARVGLMIIPSPATQSLSVGEMEIVLLPVLVEANKTVPAYAQLSWDMVRVLSPETRYPRTDKGTVIRAAFYKVFSSQIEDVYESAETSSGELCLSKDELKTYLRRELKEIVPASTADVLQDDTDFFSVGLDSLQAIRLRSVLSKNIQTNGAKLTSNIVFDFPSIDLLAAELYRLRTGGESAVLSSTSQMKELITNYSHFTPHTPVTNDKEGQFLVVTGATGSLGAHLVSQLVIQPDVKRVYCLVRAKTKEQAHQRVVQSLRDRAVYHHLPLTARNKIIATPSDFSKVDLGLESALHETIISEITALIHCAWSVNFNLSLTSFEADCIAGAHNLLSFCLQAKRPSPATFNFCSSVSTVAATQGGFVPESLPVSLEYAQNMGYAQSKLVTEHICVEAAKHYGIKTRVLRVGQVVADTVHGIWNATEAIPLMMQAALTIGAIPTLDETPLWLPVDTVASTIADISLSSANAAVLNIVNHQAFHWTRDLLPALHRAGLDFEELPQREWIANLRASNPDPVANPPIKLVEFFASKYDNDKVKKGLTYDTSHARFLSSALATAPVLNQDLVDKFVRNFKATSWATSSMEKAEDVEISPRKRLIVITGSNNRGVATMADQVSQKLDIPILKHDTSTGSSLASSKSSADFLAQAEMLRSLAIAKLHEGNRNSIIIAATSLSRAERDELRKSRIVQTKFVLLQQESEHGESEESAQERIGIEERDCLPLDAEMHVDDVVVEVAALLT